MKTLACSSAPQLMGILFCNSPLELVNYINERDDDVLMIGEARKNNALPDSQSKIIAMIRAFTLPTIVASTGLMMIINNPTDEVTSTVLLGFTVALTTVIMAISYKQLRGYQQRAMRIEQDSAHFIVLQNAAINQLIAKREVARASRTKRYSQYSLDTLPDPSRSPIIEIKSPHIKSLRRLAKSFLGSLAVPSTTIFTYFSSLPSVLKIREYSESRITEISQEVLPYALGITAAVMLLYIICLYRQYEVRAKIRHKKKEWSKHKHSLLSNFKFINHEKNAQDTLLLLILIANSIDELRELSEQHVDLSPLLAEQRSHIRLPDTRSRIIAAMQAFTFPTIVASIAVMMIGLYPTDKSTTLVILLESLFATIEFMVITYFALRYFQNASNQHDQDAAYLLKLQSDALVNMHQNNNRPDPASSSINSMTLINDDGVDLFQCRDVLSRIFWALLASLSIPSTTIFSYFSALPSVLRSLQYAEEDIDDIRQETLPYVFGATLAVMLLYALRIWKQYEDSAKLLNKENTWQNSKAEAFYRFYTPHLHDGALNSDSELSESDDNESTPLRATRYQRTSYGSVTTV